MRPFLNFVIVFLLLVVGIGNSYSKIISPEEKRLQYSRNSADNSVLNNVEENKDTVSVNNLTLVSDRIVVVDLTTINYSKITVLPPATIAIPETNSFYKINIPVDFTVNGKMLTFNINNSVITANSVIISNEESNVVAFKSSKDYKYNGTIKLIPNKGNIKLINSVALEDYVKSVLFSEFTPKASMEAIKAQAVAIRTYVLKKMMAGDNYHLCDTTHCQTYTGYKENENYERAVKETAGEVLVCNGNIISAMYSSDAGGITNSWVEVNKDPKYSYLDSVADPFSIQHESWRYVISYADFAKKLMLKDKAINSVIVKDKYSSNRVKDVLIKCQKDILVSGDDLRKDLGYSNLKSTMFDVETKEDSIVFTGLGSGHGYGLCQKSVIEMGKVGYYYKDILEYFYKGTQIVKI